MCKDRNVPLPQANISLPGGPPSTSIEPRVPPLPNELITAAAPPDPTTALPPLSSSKRNKPHGTWKSVGGHGSPSLGQQQPKQEHKQQYLKELMDQDQEEAVPPILNMELLHSLKGFGRYDVVTVQECTRAGITEDLAKEVKECKIELERIDQELLELGPFAKEMYHELSPSRRNNPILLPGMVAPRGSPVATPPDLLIHHYQQHQSPLRRTRKVNRQSSSNKVASSKDVNVPKKKSEDGYASSPMSTSSVGVGEERIDPAERLTAKDSNKEAAGKGHQQQANPQKGKWRKVGSAGSPVVLPRPPPSSKATPNSYPQIYLSSSNSSSPVSDSSHYSLPATTATSKEKKIKSRTNTGATKDLEADVNSPSMIPAASEIEMLSLYMPNSPWETIGSSPLHSDHGSTPDVHAVVGNGSSAERTAEGHQRTGSDVSLRSYSSPLSASQNALRMEKASSAEASPQTDTPPQKPQLPVNISSSGQGSSNWQSPLANSMARYSPEPTVALHSEAREPTPDAYRVMPPAVPPTHELKRHVVVRDGTPVCMPSSAPKPGFSVSHLAGMHEQQQQQQHSQQYQHHPAVSHMVREHRSATPVDHFSPPNSAGSLATPHPHSHHLSNVDVSSVKHRRTSSSSSLRSLKQQHSVDDAMSTHSLPSPVPAHTRVSAQRQTTSPLSQQALQQVQLLSGVSVGDAKLANSILVVSESSKLAMMNAAASGVPWLPSVSAAGSQLAAQGGFLGPPGSMASAMSASGLPCYPFSFLPGGGNWLPTAGGMLATAGLPSPLRPQMISLDPNSAYKSVFNPLLPYRYPLAVSQSFKNFPSTTSPHVSQSPSGIGGTNINQTSSGSVTPQGVVYPVAPSPSLSAFHTIGGEPIGVGSRTGQATPPLLCLQPGQTQGYPGVLPPQVLMASGAEDNSSGGTGTKGLETSVAAPPPINWIQNPTALIGSGTNFMPYLMSQPQFGIAGAPGGQQAVNLLANSPLAGGTPQSALHGSDSNLTKIGGGSASNAGTVLPSKDHPAMFVPRRPQPQRRGSSASVELVRGELSPSNTPPLGVGQGSVGMGIGGSKKTQYSMKVPHDGKWKPGGDQQSNPPLVIHPFEYQNVDSSQSATPAAYSSTSGVPMMPPSTHMIQPGFPGMGITHSRLPKGRGEMVIGAGRGSPRGINDKPKLRMHHVRDDDFKQPIKPDRRRKRWRGKNKDSYLSMRAEEAEASLHRMGKLGEPLGPLPPFPQSMAMEIDRVSRGMPEKYPMQRDGDFLGMPKPVSGTRPKDGNYALNMLADMSSIQSKERQDGGMLIPVPPNGNRTNESASNNIPPPALQPNSEPSQLQIRSPVSLAARSLLMLGEDLNQPQNVTHVENTAATSLLQLSGAVVSEENKSQKEVMAVVDQNPVDSNTPSGSRSASFSAAEAMIMMGSASEPGKKSASNISGYTEVFEASRNSQSPSASTDHTKTPSGRAQPGQVDAKCGPVRSRRPHSISLDSEVTDTDSEATLTPDSPSRSRKNRPPELISISPMPVNKDENTESVLLQSSLQGMSSHTESQSECDDNEAEGEEEEEVKCVDASLNSSQHISWDRVDDKRSDSQPASVVSSTNSSTITTAASLSTENHRFIESDNCGHSSLFYSTVGPTSVIPAPTRLTVTGTFTPPPPTGSLPNENQEESPELVKMEGMSQTKLPKFISTFGPVSENITQFLPVQIDGGSTEGRSSSLSSLNQPGEKNKSSDANSPSVLVNSNAGDTDPREGNGVNSEFAPKEICKSLEDDLSNDLIPNNTVAGRLLAKEPASVAYTPESTLTAECPEKSSPPASVTEKAKQRIKIKRHNTRVVPVAGSALTETATPSPNSDTNSNCLPSWTAFANAVDCDSCDREKAEDREHGNTKEHGLSDNENVSDTSSMTDEILSSGEVNKVIETIDEGLAQSPLSVVAVSIHSDGNGITADDGSTAVSENLTPPTELIGNKLDDSHHGHSLHESKHAKSKRDEGDWLRQEQNTVQAFQMDQQQCSQGVENASGNGKVYKVEVPHKTLLYHAKQSTSHRDYEHHGQYQFDSDGFLGKQTKSHVGSDSDTVSTTNKSQALSQGSPGLNSQLSTSNKAAERFSPLSDDDFPGLPVSSPRSVHRDSYSKLSEVEDLERKQKRYQGEYYDSVVPSPASSTSSSSTKKHHSRQHHHHHRHQERFSGGELPLSSKRDHHREKSASTSRGSSPADHKKGRHRHHHHSSHHHRGHSRDGHSSHEVPKDDHLVGGGASRLSKEGWHESTGGTSRKRAYISSDEDDASMLQEFSGGPGSSSFIPSIKRKMKHSREHKERWKEHKHGLHKH